jgi:hypothetical protein
MKDNCDQNWLSICDALEEMMDAADDAWEAEQKGSINKRDQIKESRYEPAKIKLKKNIDQYIDARIKVFIREHTNAKLTSFADDVITTDEY